MEAILVASVMALAALGLAAGLGRPRVIPVVLLVLGIGVATAVVVGRYGPDPAPEVTDRPLEIEDDGYVSSDTCRPCHPQQYATWYGSYHRTMTQVAGPESVVVPFDSTIEYYGREYVLERRGDEFWVDMDMPIARDAAGRLPRFQSPVVMTTGSHHMQLYWYATGHARLVALLPVIYLIDEKRWVPRDSVFLAPPTAEPNIGPRWNTTCIRCHATHGRQRRLAADEFDTHVSELGISCQACHGPGEEHVRKNRNPLRRYRNYFDEGAEGTITQPERLTARPSSQVCGQCHSVHYFHNQDDFGDWNENGFRYRPGDDLADTALLVHHSPDLEGSEMQRIHEAYPQYRKEDRFWSDGMIRVSGREYSGLAESPCMAGGEFSCLSCHKMHKSPDDPRSLKEWANDQLAPGMRGDEACLQCHERFREDPEQHTHHLAGSNGSRCYNCHMPYTTYGLLKAIRSHQVSSPSVAESVETGRPNACNQCHLDKTLAWTSEHLGERYGTPPVELTGDERKIAASVLWSVKGDAGQRALMAWSLGWDAAREASGEDWMPGYLTQLMGDRYDAVRFIAGRSLSRIPGIDSTDYDAFGERQQRVEITRRIFEEWEAMQSRVARANEELLIDPQGLLRRDEVTRLLRDRDNRPVILKE